MHKSMHWLNSLIVVIVVANRFRMHLFLMRHVDTVDTKKNAYIKRCHQRTL